MLSIDVSEAEKVPGFLGCALPEEAPQAYFNCSGNPPSPLLMADEKVLTTEPLTIGDRVAVVADGVPTDQKHRHRRRQHHAGPPLHLLQPAAPVANGLACHEHLPILVTRFLVPAAEEGERSGFYKYAMRTTIDFPIINFALRCGGNRPARLAAGALGNISILTVKHS